MSAIGKLRSQAQATPHTEKCCRAAADAYEAVYGKPDPNCPRCAIDRKASRLVAASMF